MGQPAARLTDMHLCPMVTPGVPPIPHVGGPIIGPGCPTVLIGGMPASVVTDMVICVGPPDTIVMGSMTVFLGGMPAARMGDQCSHGGAIIIGCPTVLVGGGPADGGGIIGGFLAFASAFVALVFDAANEVWNYLKNNYEIEFSFRISVGAQVSENFSDIEGVGVNAGSVDLFSYEGTLSDSGFKGDADYYLKDGKATFRQSISAEAGVPGVKALQANFSADSAIQMEEGGKITSDEVNLEALVGPKGDKSEDEGMSLDKGIGGEATFKDGQLVNNEGKPNAGATGEVGFGAALGLGIEGSIGIKHKEPAGGGD